MLGFSALTNFHVLKQPGTSNITKILAMKQTNILKLVSSKSWPFNKTRVCLE